MARLTGIENIFDGTVIERQVETALLRVEELNCQLTIPNTLKQDKLSLGIRPARIIAEQDHSPRTEDLVNRFPGRIVQTIPTPDGQIVFIQLARDNLTSLSNNSSLSHRQRDYDLQAYVPFNYGKSDHGLFKPRDLCQVTFPISAMSLWPQD